MARRAKAEQGIEREWLDLRGLAQYAAVSERTLRSWIHRAENALPAVRVEGKILVRKSQFDVWLERYRLSSVAAVDVDAIVDALLRDAR